MVIQAVSTQEIFLSQKKHSLLVGKSTADERIEKLNRIEKWIQNNLESIQDALHDDLRRHPDETLLGEILAVNTEIKHTRKNLAKWMKPQKVSTPISVLGTSAYIRYEPKGQVLIIAPWNYPFNLAILPLVQAIGAGNVVILKPSELTPATSSLLKKMLNELFDEKEVAVIEGDATVATELLALPFHHIYFTGSPAVGKIVMTAAAKHLASVTLELGGKSPCVVDETADIASSAERIAWGKCLNNGQTCIAPDYLYVKESIAQSFTEALKKAIDAMYNPEGKGVEASESYSRIVNDRHFNRVQSILNDATQKGATLVYGGGSLSTQKFIAPTLLSDVTDDMRVMQEEIFGPILPILTYKNEVDVAAHIASGEKPLAMYIFSKNKKNIAELVENTSAGSTVINDTLIQYGHTNLPWGGANNSGIGKSGGYFGFQELSNARSMMKRNFSSFKMFYPPYTEKVSKLLKFALKWL